MNRFTRSRDGVFRTNVYARHRAGREELAFGLALFRSRSLKPVHPKSRVAALRVFRQLCESDGMHVGWSDEGFTEQDLRSAQQDIDRLFPELHELDKTAAKFAPGKDARR